MNLSIAYGIALALIAGAVGALLYGEPGGAAVLAILGVALALWARRGAGRR